MAKYFVHENRHYPAPGAPTQFEVRQYGIVEITIATCHTREEADARCATLTGAAETRSAKTKRHSIRALPAKNAIRCRYCHTEIQSRFGGEYVTHTCEELKKIQGPQVIIGVDGGSETDSQHTIGNPDDWYREP